MPTQMPEEPKETKDWEDQKEYGAEQQPAQQRTGGGEQQQPPRQEPQQLEDAGETIQWETEK